MLAPESRLRSLPRPTRAAALLLVIATILELLGQLIRSTGVTIAAAAALGAVIGDAALAPQVKGFELKRDIADRLTAGIAATLRLTISTSSGRRGARRSVVLVHEHPALPSTRVLTPALSAGTSAVAEATVVPDHRGHWYDGGSVTVEAYSPLGGFLRRDRIALDGELWVHPAPAPAFRLPETVPGETNGNAPAVRTGGGTDFFGIREWRSGDPATAVHWRASARRNQLVVMEREQPSRAGVLIVCGAHEAGQAWERALARAAATAIAAVRAGRPLTLVVGDAILRPTTAQQILDQLTDIAADLTTSAGAAGDAARLAGAGCAVVWLSSTSPGAARFSRSGGALVIPALTGDP